MFIRFLIIETIIAIVFMFFTIFILDYYSVFSGVSVALSAIVGGATGVVGIIIGAIVAMKIA